MPGYVMHMAVASKIIENKCIKNEEYIREFLLGNIAPDAVDRGEKKESHFWDEKTYMNLNRIPNLDDYISKYGDRMNDPFVLGYYTHLMLDNLFVKEYWAKHFTLLDEKMEEESNYNKVTYIKVNKDGKVYERNSFFSDRLYYGDYDRIYPYVFCSYPFYRIETINIKDNYVSEIDMERNLDALKRMVDKVNVMYDNRDKLEMVQLNVFDVNHIFSLMDRVVSNVCELI